MLVFCDKQVGPDLCVTHMCFSRCLLHVFRTSLYWWYSRLRGECKAVRKARCCSLAVSHLSAGTDQLCLVRLFRVVAFLQVTLKF